MFLVQWIGKVYVKQVLARFQHPTPHAYPEERREEILRAYEERSSLRGLERTFGVSRHTVIGWIKKSPGVASVERYAHRA